MFRKLISNLPFNPSLLESVAFYAKRMKQEESLRRLGLIFVVFAMFIQMYAVIAPPERSLASSGNDHILDGLKTRDDILRAWDNPSKDIAAIYSRFGLTREDIAALPMHPNVTVHSNYADYWTIGRTSLSSPSLADRNIKQQYKNSEIPVQAGPTTVYLRQLRAWDIKKPVNYYKAFEGWKNGKQFWILVDCGNFTQVGLPPLNLPSLDLRKTIDGGPRTLKPGDRFSFRFEYRNSVQDSIAATDAILEDDLDLTNYRVTSPTNLPLQGNRLVYPIGTVPYTPHYNTALVIEVELKADLRNGTKTCNAATMRASNAPTASSGNKDALCVTVINQCPLDEALARDDPACKTPVLACTLTNSDVNKTTKVFTMKTTVSSSNERLTAITGYTYDFGDGSGAFTKRSGSYTDTVTHTYKDGIYNATVVVNYRIGNGAAATDGSTNCAAQVGSEPPISQSKSAQNLTQGLDANATANGKMKAGDTIEYSLIVHNSLGYKRSNVNISDNIGDILDYAELDSAFLAQQGGTFDAATNTLSWKDLSVEADSNLVKTFRVKMKNPIPATNQPSNLTMAFDCKISNKFGNQIDLNVDCPLPKSSEYLTQQLPKTGPGSSLLIGFVTTTVIAYFFARSRIMAQELDIIRTDFAQTGGI